MRVFSVEMLVKEEGAAVVEAALKRLKNEANAVATQMKVTTSQVTTTGTAMKAAGQATEIAKDRAAKAAIGFAAVGQAIGRTGSLTADMGTRIVEAGSQMSAMFGPTGLVVSAVLAGLAAIGARLLSTRKEASDLKKRLDEMTDTANLRGLQDELDKLIKGSASKRGRDSIFALAQELVTLQEEYKKYANATGPATSEQIALIKRINELRDSLARKRDQIADIQQRMAVASDTERYHTTVVDEGASATDAAAEADRKRKEALKALNDELALTNVRYEDLIYGVRTTAREMEAFNRLPTAAGMAMNRIGGGGQTGAVDRAIGRAVLPAMAVNAEELFPPLDNIGPVALEFNQELLRAMRVDDLKETLGDGIASSIEGGITSGLEMAIASGNIADGFKAMGQAIIQSMASAMVKVALKAIGFASKLKAIQSFMASHPALALASAVALLAIARAAGGGAGGADMTATGGPSGLTYSAAGVSSGATSQIIFGSTSATTAAGMQPRSATNVTIIGPNDPTAQRAMQELMAKANSRGRVG